MLNPLNLLLISAVFSIVMLSVLFSLMRSGIPGIRAWLTANAMAAVALLLFAGRDAIPPFLSIEVANGLLAAAMCIVYAGFRRFLGCTVPSRLLAGGLTVMVVLIAVFHYLHDSIGLRILIVSIFHGALCLAIAKTVLHVPQKSISRYPYRFTAFIAVLFGLVHWLRGIVYGTGLDYTASLLQSSVWNLLFLSLGILVLPVFTMAAVMMVHDKMMEQAIAAANRDFLTGAWSRRAFFEFAERELVRAKRTGRALSLLLFDVDYFKRINDAHGHAVGDRVLQEIVQRTEKEIRGMDCVARVGGEEFAVLLPEIGAPSALVVAERLRTVLAQPPDDTHVRSVPCTVSIGVATRMEAESINELMRRADIALYAAKAGGRDMVVCAEQTSAMQPPPSPVS